MSALDSVKNLIKVYASTGYTSVATSIVLLAGEGATLPSPTPFNMVWWNYTDYTDPADDPFAEIVRVTNVATDTLTITRAQEGTTAQNHNIAGKTYALINGITALMISQIAANLYPPAQVCGVVTGTINSVNVTFTLPWTPVDPNTVILWLNQQPYFNGIHFTLSGTTVTYNTAPNIGFSGTGHYATGH